MAKNENLNYTAAVKAFSQKDYISARHLFELASKDKAFRENSLYHLILLDINENKYEKAREALKTITDLNEEQYYFLCAYLDSFEYNFDRSKSFYDKILTCGGLDHNFLMNLSNIHIKLGNFIIAEKILESLRFIPSYYIKATLLLIALKIREKDYEEALRLLNKIDKKSLRGNQSSYFEGYEKIVLFELNKLDLNEELKGSSSYVIKRLTQDDDEELLKHISKHVHPEEKRDVFYFFRYTDLKSLLEISKNKIKTLNPNMFEIADSYLFKLDEPIGINNGELTSDICVKVFPNTGKIITMYPVQLSSEFDIEGISTSEEFSHKLKLGGGY